MDVNSNPLEKKLREWLENQGYPLEMEVAKGFANLGMNVIQSDVYEDPETKAIREIDVTVSSTTHKRGVYIYIGFQIECKLAKDKPWLLFSGDKDRRAFMPPFLNAFHTKISQAFFERHISYDYGPQQLLTTQMFQSEPVGFSLTQAFTTGPDVPYQAVMSSLKAALYQQARLETIVVNDVPPPHKNYKLPCCGVIFPIIVIDGKLFQCYLDEASKVSVDEIPYGKMLWGHNGTKRQQKYIQIYTRSALPQLIQHAAEAVEAIKTYTDIFGKEIQEIAESLETPML